MGLGLGSGLGRKDILGVEGAVVRLRIRVRVRIRLGLGLGIGREDALLGVEGVAGLALALLTTASAAAVSLSITVVAAAVSSTGGVTARSLAARS